jgi:hypothetical protein
MAMTDRITCCVPFCHHTRGDRKGDPILGMREWLCAEHWRLVSGTLKARRAKFRRMYKRTSDIIRKVRICKADERAWEACKRQAIERAAGI